MTDPTKHRVLGRFAGALAARHDHVAVTHAELREGWPGDPTGKTSLTQLTEELGPSWAFTHRDAVDDYIFAYVPGPLEPSAARRTDG